MGRFENAEVFRDTERMCREEPVGTGPNVVSLCNDDALVVEP